MARNPYKLAQILERMLSVDKDLRYMAVSDLMNDTEKNELILDDDGEKKVCRHLLKLLEDKSSEVQNIVIRCIGHMTTRFNSKEINGEIYCTALKTVVTQFSPAKGGDNTTNAVKELFPKLIQLLAQSNEQLAAELMDIVSDLLLRYGPKLAAYHEQSLETIADWIQKGRSMIRKRATQALGSLATCCHQDLFKVAVEKIFQWLSSRPSDSSKLRNYVMAANYVCRSRGNQFSLYLSEILPKLKTIVEETEEEDNREAVLTTLETFLYFCSGNIADHQQQIQDILLKYLAHDPNYCVGDEDEEMDAQDASWEDDEDNQYSDTDDDLSWKVRRACAKALTSEVKYVDNTGQKLLNWMTVVAPKLIDRLRDREDHVQLEIVHALREMCSQAKKFLPEQGEKNVDAYGDLTGFAEANDEQKAVRKQLEELHPKILRGLSKLIEKKQTIARAAVFELLIVMTQALPNRLAAEFVLAAAGAGLEDKNGGSQIKMLVLQFITAALKTHEPETFLGHVPQMTNMLVKAVEDNFYKIVAEAILVLSRFATVLEKSNEMNPGATAPHINSVYSLLQQLLQKTHADQEVLHRAIYTTGVYLGLLGDHSKEPELLGLVCDIAERTVVDQATVVAALLALKTTAENSRAQQMMTGQLERILGNVATLMEKNAGGQQARSRDSIVDLQNTLLDLAVTIFNTQKVNAESASIGRLVVALPTLLRDSDLQVAHKALQCMNGTLEMGLYDRGYLPALVRLFESHLLCGFTLQTAIQTVTALAKELMRGGTAFETILDELTAPVYDQRELTKTAYKSIAMATAEIAAVSQDRGRASKLAQQLVGHLNSSNQNERLFSIQALGELGRAFPAVYEDSSLKPEQLLSQIFSNASDDLRPVAAQALGAIASGNPTRYLPFILSNLDQGGAQLPLLHAVKEVLSSRQLERGQIDKIWSVLVSHADVQEESIRAVVADCIGKLCDDNPDQGLAALQKLLVAESTNVRYTAVSAFKVLVFDAHSIQNKMLAPHLAAIGDAIKDKDMRVRRIGLIVLNALFSKRTQLMRSYVTEVLPAVYDESKVRKELIREVEMGPFKHLVDDGVDIRKAAYECMFTILERCTAEINMEEYVKNLGDGLQDSNHDIKLLTGMILARLCVLAPATLLQNLPRYTEQMKVLLLQKPKANAVRQELEKLDELKRAVIRMVRSMQKIPDSDRLLSDIVNTINFNKELQPLADKIDRDEKDQTTTNSTPMEQ